MLCMRSLPKFFVTPWTVAHQASLPMGFSGQESWSGLSLPPPGDLPDPGIKPTSPASPALAGRFFTIESLGPKEQIIHSRNAYILDDSDYTTFFKKQNNGDNKTLVVVIGGRGARDEQAELRMFLGL